MNETVQSTPQAPAARTTSAAAQPMSLTEGLPPGPRSPALIQTLRYLSKPHRLFEECGRKYGEMFTLNLLGCRTR